MADSTINKLRAAEMLRLKADLMTTLSAEIQDLASKVRDSAVGSPADSVLDGRINEMIAGLRALSPSRAKSIIESVLRDLDIAEILPVARDVKAEMTQAGQKVNQSTLAATLRTRYNFELGNFKPGIVWDAVSADSVSSNGHH